MPKIGSFRRPLLITAAVAAADLIARLVFIFEMSRVVVVEAVLFGVACLLLLWAAGRDRVASLTAGRFDLFLAIFFALGSLRASLWAAGLRVGLANLITLGVGVVIAMGYLSRRCTRRRTRPDNP